MAPSSPLLASWILSLGSERPAACPLQPSQPCRPRGGKAAFSSFFTVTIHASCTNSCLFILLLSEHACQFNHFAIAIKSAHVTYVYFFVCFRSNLWSSEHLESNYSAPHSTVIVSPKMVSLKRRRQSVLRQTRRQRGAKIACTLALLTLGYQKSGHREVNADGKRRDALSWLSLPTSIFSFHVVIAASENQHHQASNNDEDNEIDLPRPLNYYEILDLETPDTHRSKAGKLHTRKKRANYRYVRSFNMNQMLLCLCFVLCHAVRERPTGNG